MCVMRFLCRLRFFFFYLPSRYRHNPSLNRTMNDIMQNRIHITSNSTKNAVPPPKGFRLAHAPESFPPVCCYMHMIACKNAIHTSMSVTFLFSLFRRHNPQSYNARHNPSLNRTMNDIMQNRIHITSNSTKNAVPPPKGFRLAHAPESFPPVCCYMHMIACKNAIHTSMSVTFLFSLFRRHNPQSYNARHE